MDDPHDLNRFVAAQETDYEQALSMTSISERRAGEHNSYAHRSALGLIILAVTMLPLASDAQLATVGAGILMSDRAPEPVAELHTATPPILATRAYVTLSWTDESGMPTLITAAERSIVRQKAVLVGLGAGLLWLEANDYRPYPIAVSSIVVPLPLPRTAVVAIGSTQPFQDFAWSVVLKVGVTIWFVR